MNQPNLLSGWHKIAYPPFGKIAFSAYGRGTYSAMRCTWALFLIGLPAIASPLAAETPQDWCKNHLESLVTLYRDLHANPELSQQETATSERLQRELKQAGIEVTGNVGGFGLVGLLRNGN